MKESTSTDLATMDRDTGEIQVSHAQSSAQHEIQSAIIIARKFPRSEDQAFGRLMKAVGRKTFAMSATYSFPRGGTNVTGPSVNLAREAARVWGNIRYGVDVVADDDDKRTIRGWAWDVETNTRVSSEDTFKKLVQRKNKVTKQTEWVAPDERDLRELTNKHGAICVRNCLLQLLPPDIIEDACTAARKAAVSAAGENLDENRKAIIKAFGDMNVTVADLEKYLEHELRTCNAEEVADLRQVYKSIKDGNTTWSDYVGGGETPKKTRRSKLNDEPETAKVTTKTVTTDTVSEEEEFALSAAADAAANGDK